MNACISESGCVWINSTCSISLLVVKLWDLVIKKYMLELFSFYAILLKNHKTIHFHAEWFCARDVLLYTLLSVAMCVRSERDVLYALLSVAMCVWSVRDVLYAILSVAMCVWSERDYCTRYCL